MCNASLTDNVPVNHLGVWLICRFCFHGFGVGFESLHFYKAPKLLLAWELLRELLRSSLLWLLMRII